MGSGDYPGRKILGAGTPRKVLQLLTDGDPLEIGPRCQERIEERAVFVDWERLWLRSLAHIALLAPRYKGKPKLDLFLAEGIDVAIGDLIREDREEDRKGVPVTTPWDPRYAFVSEQVGMEPGLARTACIRFNGLPRGVRSTYFAVALQKKTFNRWVAEGHGPPEKIHAQLKQAFEALSIPYDGDNGPDKGGRT
jgi:hypothetical protein